LEGRIDIDEKEKVVAVDARSRSKRVSHQNPAQPAFITDRDGSVRINSNKDAEIITVKQHWKQSL
jgi:hypothetical protein